MAAELTAQAYVVCGSLWTFISVAISTLFFFTHHYCGWLQPVFQRKSLLETGSRIPPAKQENTFTTALWLLPSESCAFPFSGLFALWTKAQSSFSLEPLLPWSVSPSHSQHPCRIPLQMQMLCSIPSPPERMNSLASIPFQLSCRLWAQLWQWQVKTQALHALL